MNRTLLLLIAVFLLADSRSIVAQQVDFNRDVRPILNQHCVACHGGVKQAGELSFVYEDQALTTVEVGYPEDSLLIERVTSDDESDHMPPAEHGRALNEAEVDVLSRWIAQGADWQSHWAFVVPQKHDPPPVESADEAIANRWSENRIDPFVWDKLHDRELLPNDAAKPARWLRRVTLDLTGLPVTLQQRADFLADVERRGELAYTAAVDRLLQAPAMGHRWASVWLDAVRYADSRGLGLDAKRTIWKYRDWVIRAFNDDLPYDEFTRKQIAGDLFPEPTMDDLVATAAHRLTQTNEEGGTDDEEFRVEAVLDRINTVCQTWQGLSFGCVQCHSHPYDPIEHEEYYQFAAYFNNTVDCDLGSDEPTVAVPLDDAKAAEAIELDREIDSLNQNVWQSGFAILADEENWDSLRLSQVSTNNTTSVAVVKVADVDECQTVGNVAKSTTVFAESALSDSVEQLTAIRVTGLPTDIEKAARDSEWGFMVTDFKAELISENGDVRELKVVYVIADEPNPIIDPQLSLKPKSNYGFGAYSRINYPRSAAFVLAEPAAVDAGDQLRITLAQNHETLGAFPLVAHRIRLAISDSDLFCDWWGNETQVQSRLELAQLKSKRASIKSVRIPVMRERNKKFARPSHVFYRGNALTKTERVYPDTPAFLTGNEQADGVTPERLQLANWLADANNPLTARVQVNRIWSALFGVGLVETQEDFGSAGTPPSHPKLLDDLSFRFANEMNWSIKTLLKEIVLSATYRQSAVVSQEKLERDPSNRWLSRGPRTRLSAEIIRDQALAISGLLSEKQFGPPVHPPIPDGLWKPFHGGDKWTTPGKDDPNRYRRSIYTYTKRSIPFPMQAAFDAPSREFCNVRRLRSNTPLQALMTMNDATFVEASEAFAARMIQSSDSIEGKLKTGFLLALSRNPTAKEIAALKRLYDRTAADGDEEAMISIASVLLNLDEVLSK